MNGHVTHRAARIFFRAVVCAVCLAGASLAWGATPEDCHTLRKHGHRAEAQKCYESLTTARDPYLRAEGFWGTEMYQDANNQFRIAAEQSPANAMIRVRWGRLMHERFNNTEADNLFNEALQRDPKNAQAYYGLALVSADGFDSKAIEYTSKAIELDPKLYEARELMANLLLEDSAAIILYHNHPSGDAAPSPEDIEFTRRLKKAAELVGIRLLDHVIVARESIVSLRERGLV